ncbi:thioredoxin family protein [Streptomyces sp. NPDC085900]|uniref:thioredoxin family protein n=1 Tax=Streptomyces sp. NPDC085900 TaxID=3365737 RepID=UPI0037D5FD7E
MAVFFWAAWCGPCRMVTPNVDRLAQQHPEILAVRLDVNANPATPAKYDVKNCRRSWSSGRGRPPRGSTVPGRRPRWNGTSLPT